MSAEPQRDTHLEGQVVFSRDEAEHALGNAVSAFGNTTNPAHVRKPPGLVAMLSEARGALGPELRARGGSEFLTWAFSGVAITGCMAAVVTVSEGIDVAHLESHALRILVALAIAAVAGFGVWSEVRGRVALHAHGARVRGAFGTTELAWAQVTSLEVQRLSVGGKEPTVRVVMHDARGQRIELSSATLGGREVLETLAQQLTERVAGRLAQTLAQRGEVALMPGLTLASGRVQGQLSRAVVEDALLEQTPPVVESPKHRLDLAIDDAGVEVRVRNGWAYVVADRAVESVLPVATPNFWPAMALLKSSSAWSVEV